MEISGFELALFLLIWIGCIGTMCWSDISAQNSFNKAMDEL
jgi:hypothetical protein